GPALARAVRAALRGTGLQVRVGNKVLDVRARGADKGAAVLRWLRVVERGRVPLEHVVYAGDDTTDEDAFRALGRRAVTIAVGPRVGHARFRTASTVTFAAWLERLAGLRDMGKAAAERPRSRPSRRPPRRPRSTARDRSR
ncbi:MAG TPA: trehalose-phosphatase, partial [Gemmatimonadales bacterium]|nr:trehalose-phosphatase [Gemmatimonadales bacterium]